LQVQYQRVVAALAVGALLLTACGSRVSDEERQFVLNSMAAGGSGGDGGGGSAEDDPFAVGDGFDESFELPEAGEADALPDGEEPEAATGDGAGDGGNGGNGGNGGEATGGDGGGDDDARGAGLDTRAAPPGGNGGATDTGVTEQEIVVANVADISGAVQGLFEDAQKGAAAAVAHFTATEGTVYGRQLRFLPLDSRLDAGQARQQYLRACEQAFGAAGSMSAFEEGAVDPVRHCGIPDLRSVVTSRSMQQVDNAFGIEVQAVGQVIGAAWRFWAEQHPEAIKRSAYLYIENETTTFQTTQNRRATETIGYNWVINQPIQIAETTYDGFVQNLIREKIEFVTFQGDYTQAVRLAETMRRQNYWPTVYALQPNIYTQNFLQAGGAAIEGSHVYITTRPVEEISQVEEMQLFRQWLKQIDPRAEPSYMGIYGWSSMRLFIESLKEVGPELTREAMIEQIRTVENYTGNGLHAPQHVGPKRVHDCTLVLEVRDNRFHRLEPSRGFRCHDEPLLAP
jgi:ABC-type branched-subunit amino acid transport system substrate-binding protein